MSYENYQIAIKSRISALKDDRKRLQIHSHLMVLVPFLLAFAILILAIETWENRNPLGAVLITPLMLASAPLQMLGAPGVLSFLTGTFASLLFYYWAVAKWLVPRLPIDAPELSCPHCSHGNDLNQHWKCGWCQKEIKSDGCFHNDKSVVDVCPLEACQKHASALQCMSCGEDIVLDPEAYNTKQDFGHYRRQGVAELINVSPFNRIWGWFWR